MTIPTDGTVQEVIKRKGRDYWMIVVKRDSDGSVYILTGIKQRPKLKRGDHVEKGQEI